MSLVPVTAGSIDLADPVGHVLDLCQRGATALAEAQTVSEAKHVMAMTATIEAATKTLNLAGEAATAASALRVQAERRVGQLIQAEREAGTLAQHGGDRKLRSINLDQPEVDTPGPSTLGDHGISYDQAAEFLRLADVPEDEFTEAVTAVQTEAVKRGTNVTRSAVLRNVNPQREKRPDERWLAADRFVTSCEAVNSRAKAALEATRWGQYPGDDMTPQVRNSVVRTLSAARSHISAVLEAMERHS